MYKAFQKKFTSPTTVKKLLVVLVTFQTISSLFVLVSISECRIPSLLGSTDIILSKYRILLFTDSA